MAQRLPFLATMNKRIHIAWLLACGCGDPEVIPQQSFDITVTYDGVREGGVVQFPDYDWGQALDSQSDCEPLNHVPCPAVPTVSGTILSGTLPIASLELSALGPTDRTFTIYITRDPADEAAFEASALPGELGEFPDAVCPVGETALGHASECTETTQSCSVVLAAMMVAP